MEEFKGVWPPVQDEGSSAPVKEEEAAAPNTKASCPADVAPRASKLAAPLGVLQSAC